MAVQSGRIAALGKIDGSAATVIDAAGKIVCPGFVDPHTHYDAQITWDRLLSSSAEHGVTTVVMGNCGVGIAPCRPSDRELLTDDLVTVEGIDKEVLVEGIKWEWETFPEYIDAAEQRGSGINLAFLAPITPLRTYVLGAEANERAATPAETQTIAAMLGEAMQAGAWGFTTTASRQHIGHGGKPLAARLASREELAAYAGVLKRLERGVIELALTKRYATLAEDEEEVIKFLLDASNRPVTWLSVSNLIEKPGATMAILDRVEPLIRRGAIPQIMTRPMLFDMNLRRPFMFTEMNTAKPLFDAAFEKQMAIYADPAFREAFKAELKQGRKWATLAKNVIVVSVENPALKKYEGSTVGEIAQARNQDPNDVFFDLAVDGQSPDQVRRAARQHRPGAAGRNAEGLAHPDRSLRRRRASGHAVRVRLHHLPARSLGARRTGAHAGTRDPAHHLRTGGLFRLQGPRAAARRRGGGHRHFRRRQNQLADASHPGQGSSGGRHAPLLQGRRNLPGHRQRRSALSRWPAQGRGGVSFAAGLKQARWRQLPPPFLTGLRLATNTKPAPSNDSVPGSGTDAAAAKLSANRTCS